MEKIDRKTTSEMTDTATKMKTMTLTVTTRVELYTVYYWGWTEWADEAEHMMATEATLRQDTMKEIHNNVLWARYYADQATLAAHHFYDPRRHRAPSELPPPPPLYVVRPAAAAGNEDGYRSGIENDNAEKLDGYGYGIDLDNVEKPAYNYECDDTTKEDCAAATKEEYKYYNADKTTTTPATTIDTATLTRKTSTTDSRTLMKKNTTLTNVIMMEMKLKRKEMNTATILKTWGMKLLMKTWLQHCDRVRRCEPHEVSPLAPVDVDPGQVGDAALHVHRHGFAHSEG